MKQTAIALILSMFSLFFFAACSNQVQPQQPLNAAELLDLGEKYLLEHSYEQALVQFQRAIEIEQRNPRGYIGAADAYLGLGERESAIAILRQGLDETGDEAIRNRLADELAVPHLTTGVTDEGGLYLAYGQQDIEGRLQGFCIVNVFDADHNLIFLAEGEYLDGLREGHVRDIWFPDLNINMQYGVENGSGFGVGEYKQGERNGFNAIECYIGFSAPQARDGEVIRFDECSGGELVYMYSGNMSDNDTRHDLSGNAYMMSIALTGQRTEWLGRFEGGDFVYGSSWADGVLRHDGHWRGWMPITDTE